MARKLFAALLIACSLAGCSGDAGQVKGEDSMEKQLLEAQKNASKDGVEMNKKGGPARVGR
jgi:hypothetical protein